jgi:hypothetical protein
MIPRTMLAARKNTPIADAASETTSTVAAAGPAHERRSSSIAKAQTPAATELTNPIWKAHRRFSAPEPSRSNGRVTARANQAVWRRRTNT